VVEQKIDLQKIERRAYLSYQNDGVWDLFLGLFFLVEGFLFAFDAAIFLGIFPAMMIPVAVKIRKSFTTPRIGYVDFSPLRKLKVKKSRMTLSVLSSMTVILGLVVFMAFTGNSEWQTWVRSLGILPFGFVISVLLGAAGFLFGLKRFVFYAGFIIVIFVAGHSLNLRIQAYFIFLGVIFSVIGMVLLVHFLRRFPKPKKGAVDEGI
jgi:hypothetical protein